MQRHRHTAVLSLVFAMASAPALACSIPAPLDLKDIRYADAVVVGRIENYRIVLDQRAREDRRNWLARAETMSPELRKTLENQTSFLTDYARFDVVVDRVLSGKASKTVAVTWDNSTFGEPAAMPPGRYVVALRRPQSRMPPLRGPSTTLSPSLDPETLTVLQAPCAPAFIFEDASLEAASIRKALQGRPN